MLVVTLAFMLLNTLWIGQHLCENSCPRIFRAYRYLLIALYILEICIVVTGAVMHYIKRAMGIEGVEKIIELVCGKEEWENEGDEHEPLQVTYGSEDEAGEVSEGDDDDELIALQQSQPPAGDAKDQESF